MQMTRPNYSMKSVEKISGLIAPISGQSLGLYRAHVTNGIRQVKHCKVIVNLIFFFEFILFKINECFS